MFSLHCSKILCLQKSIQKRSLEGESHSPQNEATPKRAGKKSFKASVFTIRAKLTFIVVSVIGLSLGFMAYFTSDYFSKETTVRIQEFNLNMAQSLGQQMETGIYSLQERSRFISILSLNNKQQSLAENLFNQDPNFISLGILSVKEGGNYEVLREFRNTNYMKVNQITKEDIKKLRTNHKKYFLKSKENIFNVFNSSLENIPMLGISFLLDLDIIVALYVYPDTILKAFESHGIVTSYVVDETGDVIAHRNLEAYIKRLNLSESPIVKKLLESPVSSGQLIYEEKDRKRYLASFKKIELGNLGIISYVEEDRAFLPVRELQERNLLILGIILIISLFFIYYFAKTLSVPLMTLLKGVKEIEKENYDLEIKPAFRDEIGSLTNSFIDMTYGLKERSMAKDALGRFVNRHIAEQAMQGKIKLGGEKKYACISFIDLRNFTSMAEKMRAEDVVSFLNEYFKGVVACIVKTGGIVDKYMGDAVMSHWGAMGEVENEAEAAITSALEVRKFVREFNQNLPAKGGRQNVFIRTGCGVHSGEVISGQIGSDERMEYTVVGDTVNVASRLESLNKPLGTDILISHETYMRVQGKFKVEVMPPIRVRGKSKPQIIYAVLGLYGSPDTPENLQVLREQFRIPYDIELLQQAGMSASSLRK